MSEVKICVYGYLSVKCIVFYCGFRLNFVFFWKGILCFLFVVNDKVKVFNYKCVYFCRWNKKFYLLLYVFLINLFLSIWRSIVDYKCVSRNRFYILIFVFSILYDNIDIVEGKVFEYIFLMNLICYILMILFNILIDKFILLFF